MPGSGESSRSDPAVILELPLSRECTTRPPSGKQFNRMKKKSRQKNSSRTTESDEDCCGWLWKKSGLFRSWKYRFFSLRGALLTYYDKFPAEEYLGTSNGGGDSVENLGYVPTRGETPPRGVLRVAHVEPGENSSIAIKVYSVSGKIIDLRADTPKTAKRWIEKLQFAARIGCRKESGTGSMLSASTDSCSTVASLSEEELGRMSNFVDKFGWLRKRERGTWKNRFFVIQGNMLANYNDDLPWTVPNGRAYVTGVVKSAQSSTGLVIQLSVGKKAIVHAETRDDRNQWYDALKEAMVPKASK